MDKRLIEAFEAGTVVVGILGGEVSEVRGIDERNLGRRSRRTGNVSKPNIEHEFFSWKKA